MHLHLRGLLGGGVHMCDYAEGDRRLGEPRLAHQNTQFSVVAFQTLLLIVL